MVQFHLSSVSINSIISDSINSIISDSWKVTPSNEVSDIRCGRINHIWIAF